MELDWQAWVRGHREGVAERGGESFLTIDTALAAMDWIEASDVLVLGIEGFWLTPDETRPSERHIADYSELTGQADGQRRSVETARRHLEAWRGDIDAVILVLSPPDGARPGPQ